MVKGCFPIEKTGPYPRYVQESWINFPVTRLYLEVFLGWSFEYQGRE